MNPETEKAIERLAAALEKMAALLERELERRAALSNTGPR